LDVFSERARWSDGTPNFGLRANFWAHVPATFPAWRFRNQNASGGSIIKGAVRVFDNTPRSFWLVEELGVNRSRIFFRGDGGALFIRFVVRQFLLPALLAPAGKRGALR